MKFNAFIFFIPIGRSRIPTHEAISLTGLLITVKC